MFSHQPCENMTGACYTNKISKQTTTAKKATPSIRAAATIILERMSPAASGWRTDSNAVFPIFPIPYAAAMAVIAEPTSLH